MTALMDSSKKIFVLPVAHVCDMEKIEAAFSAELEAIAEFAEALKKAIDSILNSKQIYETMAALADELKNLYIPKEKLPRPPKYAGIKNKARTWTPAPARVARSNCRKYRRGT